MERGQGDSSFELIGWFKLTKAAADNSIINLKEGGPDGDKQQEFLKKNTNTCQNVSRFTAEE